MPYIPYIPWPAGLGSPLVALQEELVLRPSGRGLWPLGEGGPCGADLWLPRGLQEPWRFSMVGWFWWLDGWIFRSWWEESSRDVMDVMGRSLYHGHLRMDWIPQVICCGKSPNTWMESLRNWPQKTAPKNGPRNWFHGWSGAKKEWCCAHKSRGCPGDFHGHWQHHIKVHVEQHGVGHGGAGESCGATSCNFWSCFRGKSSDLGSIMTETLTYPQEFDIVYIIMFTQRIRDIEPVRGTLWLTPDTLVKSSYVHLGLVGLRRLSWRNVSYFKTMLFVWGLARLDR